MRVLSQGKRGHFHFRAFGSVGFCIRGSLVVDSGAIVNRPQFWYFLEIP